MIHHILKIIWNERRINAWIVLEYVLVFCVLWFCCDFLQQLSLCCCDILASSCAAQYHGYC